MVQGDRVWMSVVGALVGVGVSVFGGGSSSLSQQGPPRPCIHRLTAKVQSSPNCLLSHSCLDMFALLVDGNSTRAPPGWGHCGSPASLCGVFAEREGGRPHHLQT